MGITKKPILILIAIFNAIAVFCSALVWQNFLPISRLFAILFLIIGLVGLVLIFIFGYIVIEEKPKGPRKVKFAELHGDELSMAFGSRDGLRLTWEIDGNVHIADIYDFPATIGRGEKEGVVIKAPAISRLHAEITFDGEEYKIKDLGSSNGTAVDGIRIDESTRITQDSEIKLGSIKLTIANI